MGKKKKKDPGASLDIIPQKKDAGSRLCEKDQSVTSSLEAEVLTPDEQEAIISGFLGKDASAHVFDIFVAEDAVGTGTSGIPRSAMVYDLASGDEGAAVSDAPPAEKQFQDDLITPGSTTAVSPASLGAAMPHRPPWSDIDPADDDLAGLCHDFGHQAVGDGAADALAEELVSIGHASRNSQELPTQRGPLAASQHTLEPQSGLCALDNSDTLGYDYSLGPQSDIRGASVSGSLSMHVDFQTHARATLPDVFFSDDDEVDGDACDGSHSDITRLKGTSHSMADMTTHSLDDVKHVGTSRTQCGPLPREHMHHAPCAQAPPSAMEHAQHAPHALGLLGMQTSRTQCGPLPQEHMQYAPCAQAHSTAKEHAQHAPHALGMQTLRTQCGPLPHAHADFKSQFAGAPTPQADEEDYVCPFVLFDDALPLESAGGGDSRSNPCVDEDGPSKDSNSQPSTALEDMMSALQAARSQISLLVSCTATASLDARRACLQEDASSVQAARDSFEVFAFQGFDDGNAKGSDSVTDSSRPTFGPSAAQLASERPPRGKGKGKQEKSRSSNRSKGKRSSVTDASNSDMGKG